MSFEYENNNTIESLSEVFKTLASGATITITNVPESSSAALTLNLTLSGFVKIESTSGSISASKPNYNLGSAVTIDDKNTIDGASLLRSEDLKKPDEKDLKADCGTGKEKKKRACANCTCGLAEEIAKNDSLSVEQREDPKSACGSCYLGDAFRCASCPYLGKPAFKPGEKPSLVMLDDDSMDI
ncbi:unnamed protein product [Oikopleura dioica]|uniref:Anamorsin homolog n=1 Tax=Oikopleura dioica TaxID=34765 RepID=E4X2R7_OIKDI|nr:unnamed protein product [Oikopleura dioica]